MLTARPSQGALPLAATRPRGGRWPAEGTDTDAAGARRRAMISIRFGGAPSGIWPGLSVLRQRRRVAAARNLNRATRSWILPVGQISSWWRCAR